MRRVAFFSPCTIYMAILSQLWVWSGLGVGLALWRWPASTLVDTCSRPRDVRLSSLRVGFCCICRRVFLPI